MSFTSRMSIVPRSFNFFPLTTTRQAWVELFATSTPNTQLCPAGSALTGVRQFVQVFPSWGIGSELPFWSMISAAAMLIDLMGWASKT